jgi:hypothetical protein
VRPDLDQLFPEAGRATKVLRPWASPGPHEVAEVVGQYMEVGADGVRGLGGA